MKESDGEAKRAIQEIYFKGKDACYIFLEGDVRTHNNSRFFELMLGAPAICNHRVVVDLSRVKYISEGALLTIHNVMDTCRQNEDGDLVVVDPNQDVRKKISTLECMGTLSIYSTSQKGNE